MIKVEVINDDFTLARFNELKNIVRKSKEEKGKLFKGDTFECSEELCDYLSGNNPLNKKVVKIIEVEPKKQLEEVVEDPKEEISTDVEVIEIEEKPTKNKKKKKK